MVLIVSLSIKDTQHNDTQSRHSAIWLSVAMLNATFCYCYAECHYAECHYTESRGAHPQRPAAFRLKNVHSKTLKNHKTPS